MSASSEKGITLLDGRVRMSSSQGLRPTTDTVFLAAAVTARAGHRVLDAGTGSGGAALCLAARVPGVLVTGLEREAAPAASARENITANAMDDRVDVVEADLASAGSLLGRESFDAVITNPPYLDPATSRGSPDPLRHAATVESMPLASWLEACLSFLKPGGEIVVVHRADRAGELTETLERCAGSVMVMELLAGGAGNAPARRILVRAVKGGEGPLCHVRPLVLHGANGAYTDAADAVLRYGQALDWLALGPGDTK